MKVYKVTYYEKMDSSAGFSFHGTMKEARAMLTKYIQQEGENFEEGMSGIEKLSLPLNREAVLRFLNLHAGHADNGGGEKPD